MGLQIILQYEKTDYERMIVEQGFSLINYSDCAH